MHKLLLKILITFSFCQGLLYYLGYEGIIYKSIILFLTYLTLISIFPLRTRVIPKDKFFLLFIFYIIIIIISSFVNQSNIKDIVSYTNYILPAFFVYLFISKVNFN